MSVFKGLFGKKKEEAPNTQDALQKVRDTEELLLKKQELLQKKIEQEVATAKKHGQANKRLALQALKRKKQYEAQLENIDGTLTTLQHQRDSLENASVNAEVLQVLGGAAKAMKKAHGNMNPDDIHNLMDDIAEQQDVAKEIQEAISQPGAISSGVDDDELMKELEELEAAELEGKLLDAGPVPIDNLASKLPAAPTADLPAPAKRTAAKKKEEDDLAELEAWANG
ncbi:charged multivesicular body protein 4b [Aphelenchoides avenae]|nr:charged multivesicular body protein 4b [Aphelenchus avenae]